MRQKSIALTAFTCCWPSEIVGANEIELPPPVDIARAPMAVAKATMSVSTVNRPLRTPGIVEAQHRKSNRDEFVAAAMPEPQVDDRVMTVAAARTALHNRGPRR